MKRRILSIIFLFCLIPSLFATGIVGLSVYQGFGWFDTIINKDSDYLTTTIDTSLFLDAANYFGDKHSFGIGYGLGIGFPIYTSDNSDVGKDSSVSLMPKLSFQYKYDFSEHSSIEAGAGVLCEYKSNNSFEQKMVSLFANTNYMLTFGGGSFAFRAGLEIATPVYTSIQILEKNTAEGEYTKLWKLENYGIILKPYVGASFCY